MKTTTLIIALFIGFGIRVSAQTVTMSSAITGTRAGIFTSQEIGTETQKGWGLAVYHEQRNSWMIDERVASNTYNTYGFSVQAPVFHIGKVQALANLKVGKVNKYFVVAQPTVEARVALPYKFAISAEAGYRFGHLSPALRITKKFN